jgi:hypothetical protein
LDSTPRRIISTAKALDGSPKKFVTKFFDQTLPMGKIFHKIDPSPYTRNGKVRDCAKKSGISLVIPDLPVFPSAIPDLRVIPDFRSGISLFSL